MWLENIRDWCVSRQLWWGHRIPAYFARLITEDAGLIDQNDPAQGHRWVVARTENEAKVQAAVKLGVPEDQIVLTQATDR